MRADAAVNGDTMRLATILVLQLSAAGSLVLAQSSSSPELSPHDEWNRKLAESQDRDPYWLDHEGQRREPFQIFDNLYYVGLQRVGAHLLTTSEGLILIDATFDNLAYQLLDNIRKLGFDPADIRYIICTHAHHDHASGVKRIQQASGAQVVMAAGDWVLMEGAETSQRFRFPSVPRGIVAREGDSITLGETTIQFFLTPGHTPGVLTMRYDVHDGENTYRALTFGGPGTNFQGVNRAEMFLRSLEKLQAMDGVEVHIPPHPFLNDEFEKAKKLKARKAGEPHPFVDPEEFQAFLESLVGRGKEKLAREKERK